MNPNANGYNFRCFPIGDRYEINYYDQLKEALEFDEQFEKDLLPQGIYSMKPLCLDKALENVISQGKNHFKEYNANGYSEDVLMTADLTQVFPPKKETSYAQVVSGHRDRSTPVPPLHHVIPNVSQLFAAKTMSDVRNYEYLHGGHWRRYGDGLSTPESSSSGSLQEGSIPPSPRPSDALTSTSSYQSRKGMTICFFCQKNNDSKYNTHRLRDRNGVLECPILRKYVCPLCGGTGDEAHTIGHCPLNDKTKSNVCTSKKNSYGKIRTQDFD